MADKLTIRWRENGLSIRTARLNVSADFGEVCAPHVDVCKLSDDGRTEQMFCFDGRHFHAKHDQQSANLVDGNLISSAWDYHHVTRPAPIGRELEHFI